MHLTIALLSALATSVIAAPVEAEIPSQLLKRAQNLYEDVIPVANGVPVVAGDIFNDPAVPNLLPSILLTRQEPDPDRPATIPDYVFVVQCLDAGFRGDCLVFGAPPGTCVSYFSFDGDNSTAVSDKYNNAVSSLSTNTGGVCQFYK